MSRVGLRGQAVARTRHLPERHGGRAALSVVCLIVALGLGLRLYYAIATANPTPDSRGYALIAQSLYTDQRYGQAGDFANKGVQEPSNYSPGVPLLVAGVYYLTFGVHPLIARLVLALIAALAVPLTYLLGRRLGGPRAGVLGALVVAVYPILVSYSGMYMTEPVAVTCLAAAVLAFLWAGERTDPRAWALPGALFGVTALVRPEYLAFGLLFAALALVRVGRDRGRRPGAAAATLLVAAFLVPIVPWTVRNLITLDRLVPLSTGGGKALFIGTYLPGDGTNDGTKTALFERAPVQDFVRRAHPGYKPSQSGTIFLDEVLAHLAHRRHPGLATDSALARMGRENLNRYVSEDPGAYVGMFARKAVSMWKKGAGGPGLPVMHSTGWLWFHRAVVLLGAAGLALLAWRRRWEAVVFGPLLVGITLLGALLLPSPRRALIVLPLVAALAGYALLTLATVAARALRARAPVPGGPS